MKETLEKLKVNLQEVYLNLKTTDDLHKLEEIVEEIFNTSARNEDLSFKERLVFFSEFNALHTKNKDYLLKALCKGDKRYKLEADDVYLHRTYEIPKEGAKFIDEILNRYTLTEGLTKLPVVYSLRHDRGLAIGANEVIYRLKEI